MMRTDFAPAIAALMRWGDRWQAGDAGPPLVFRHDHCGQITEAVVVCACCAEPLQAGNAIVKLDVKVIDNADHKEIVTKSFPVSDQAIRVSIISEGGKLVPDMENRLFLAAIYGLYRLAFAHRLRVPGASRGRAPRLGVVDVFGLDGQRQLVIVRRDNVEHLLMIGGPNDIVVESQIMRSASGSRFIQP